MADNQESSHNSFSFKFHLVNVSMYLVIKKMIAANKANLLLLLFSIVISLYVVEAALSFIDRVRKAPQFFSPTLNPDFRALAEAASRAGLEIDSRTKLEVVESYQQQGIEAWPSVFPSSLLARGFSMESKSRQILPLGGISRVLTVYCNDNTGGGWVVYQSDEHGFHNPEGPYDADGIDIAIVGDSFAQGHCVRSEETVASIIRNDYENTLSFGTNGSGPLTNLATLNEFVQPIKPKIVLWFYFEGNDLLDLEREKRSVFLLQYLQADFHQGLYSIQDEVDCKLREFVKQEQRKAEEKRIRWHVDLHGVFRFLNLTMLRAQLRSLFPNSEVSGSDYPFDKKLFFRILMRAKEISRRMGSHLYFVYLPSWERFSNSIYLNPYREQILKLVNNVKVPIIDMGEVFSEHDAPLTLFPFRLRGHYTRDGYRLVATTILSSLADDGKK